MGSYKCPACGVTVHGDRPAHLGGMTESTATCGHGRALSDSNLARLSAAVVEAAVAELEHRNRWGYDLTKLENARINAVQALIAARKEQEASRG